MKKRAFVFLLFCLLLTACTTPPELGTEAPATLPTLNRPTLEDSTISTTAPPEEALPTLETRTVSAPLACGPAGSVYAVYYRNSVIREALYWDLEGDGETELIYRTSYTLNGTTYDSLVVYGLEAGWPVRKYGVVCVFDTGTTALVMEGDRVCYRYEAPDLGVEGTLLPVTAAEGRLLLNGGELPEGLLVEENVWGIVGCSYRAAKELLAERILATEPNYFLYQEPGGVFTRETLGDWELVCAAVTRNGVTVTGAVYWFTDPEGNQSCSASLISTPQRFEDPKVLLGLTEKALTDQLGEPCWEDLRNDHYAVLCWFTEDRKLLTVHVEDKVVSATLTDLFDP